MAEQMKLVCEKTINGVTQVVLATTPVGNQGSYVKSIAGVGNPFWMWNAVTVPAGQRVVGCDFTNAPIVNSDAAVNNTAIAAITATPEDVLTFGPI